MMICNPVKNVLIKMLICRSHVIHAMRAIFIKLEKTFAQVLLLLSIFTIHLLLLFNKILSYLLVISLLIKYYSKTWILLQTIFFMKACHIKCITCLTYDVCTECLNSGTSLPDCSCKKTG